MHALRRRLSPNAKYAYKVGQEENPPSELSREFTFRAPKAAGDSATPTKFLMWADMGTDQYNTLEHFGNVDNALALTTLATQMLIDDDTIGLITHAGDLSYACGDASRTTLSPPSPPIGNLLDDANGVLLKKQARPIRVTSRCGSNFC